MTFRDYFCIFEVVVFTIGTVLFLMKYFCINPGYKLLTPGTDKHGFWLFVFMMYYSMSVLSVLIEVLLGGHVNENGLTFYELITFSSVIPLLVGICYGVYRVLKSCIIMLNNKHTEIYNKRIGKTNEE